MEGVSGFDEAYFRKGGFLFLKLGYLIRIVLGLLILCVCMFYLHVMYECMPYAYMVPVKVRRSGSLGTGVRVVVNCYVGGGN